MIKHYPVVVNYVDVFGRSWECVLLRVLTTFYDYHLDAVDCVCSHRTTYIMGPYLLNNAQGQV